MMIKKILIAIDDSKYADHAAAYGFDLASKLDAEVGLVNIVEPIIVPPITGADPMTGLPTAGIDDLEILDMQKEQSENIVERAIRKYAGDMPVKHFSDYGTSADGIINCSKEFGADLIIIGTHNRHGIDRLLMGSVAAHVVRHSHIPVLVVPMAEGK